MFERVASSGPISTLTHGGDEWDRPREQSARAILAVAELSGAMGRVGSAGDSAAAAHRAGPDIH